MTTEGTSDEPIYSRSEVIDILDQIAATLGEARAVPFSANVIVNQAEILELIENAREALPHDVVKADEIVGKAHVVLDKADDEAEQVMANADTYAEQKRSEADTYSSKTRSEADAYVNQAHADADADAKQRAAAAKQQADEIVAKAKAQGRQILEEAHAHAKELVKNETVYREAVTRAEGILAKAREDGNRMTDDTNRYVAEQLAKLEEAASAIAKQARSGRDQMGRR